MTTREGHRLRPDGAERCSGLPVRRYDVEQLRAALGSDLKTAAENAETHLTPWGARQAFVYGLFETPSARSDSAA
jgi:hypothetical protein